MKPKKQVVTLVNGVLTVKYPTIGKTFTADTRKYSEPMQAAARDHGFKQKFGDAESGGTPAEKYAAVQEIHKSLLAGEWERTGERDMTEVILTAVSRLKKIPLVKLQKAAEVNPDQVAEWRAHPQVKAEVARIRLERATAAAKDAEDFEIELEDE